MIFRSSVWLGFPGFIANISVVNGTDVWPSTFCVGSAVGAEIIPPFFCSQLRVPPQGESERKTAVSKRKRGCESEPGYDGFSLCHTPANAFMPPCVRLGPGRRCVGRGSDWSPGSVVFTTRRNAGRAEYTQPGTWDQKDISNPKRAVYHCLGLCWYSTTNAPVAPLHWQCEVICPSSLSETAACVVAPGTSWNQQLG